jgi:hypothetical protein
MLLLNICNETAFSWILLSNQNLIIKIKLILQSTNKNMNAMAHILKLRNTWAYIRSSSSTMCFSPLSNEFNNVKFLKLMPDSVPSRQCGLVLHWHTHTNLLLKKITLTGETPFYKHQKDLNCSSDFMLYTKFSERVGLEAIIETNIRVVVGLLHPFYGFSWFSSVTQSKFRDITVPRALLYNP